jgi:hypothetical protein
MGTARTTESKQMTIDEFIAKLGLTMTSEPADSTMDADCPMVGWTVTIGKEGTRNPVVTNYSMGVGRIEKRVKANGDTPEHWFSYHDSDVVVYVGQEYPCRNGRSRYGVPKGQQEVCTRKVIYVNPFTPIASLSLRAVGFRPEVPKIADVLDCLRSDTSSVDYGFKNWADEYGYDTDSIKAKSIFDACVEIKGKLMMLLGRAGFAELQECEGL